MIGGTDLELLDAISGITLAVDKLNKTLELIAESLFRTERISNASVDPGGLGDPPIKVWGNR